MGKKVHPKAIRIGINKQWSSQWFSRINKGSLKKYKDNLKEDYLIRTEISKTLKNAALEEIQIKRSQNQLNIIINTARPGLIIGKSGKDIELLRKKMLKIISPKTVLKIDIEEVRKPESNAQLIAHSIAEQLERRFPYRRIMKKTLDKITLGKEVRGIKIRLAGRLNGAEIARTEWLSKGKIPLQTFKANIDFAQDVARTTYGAIGIKIWVYKEDAQNIKY